MVIITFATWTSTGIQKVSLMSRRDVKSKKCLTEYLTCVSTQKVVDLLLFAQHLVRCFEEYKHNCNPIEKKQDLHSFITNQYLQCYVIECSIE